MKTIFYFFILPTTIFMLILLILQCTTSRKLECIRNYIDPLNFETKELRFIVKSKIKQLLCIHKVSPVHWKKGSNRVFYIASCMKCNKDYEIASVSKYEWKELQKKPQKKGTY